MIDGRRRQPAGRRREAARLPLRHHLRPEQRVRLRLPARQHEVLARSSTRSARSTTPSSTRSTRSSSTRRARRSSSAARASASSEKYRTINEIIPRLRNDEHYVVDEKAHSVTLTDDGVERSAEAARRSRNLYDPVNLETLHILNQCLRAHTLYKRDVNYMVRRRRQGAHHRRVHRPRARRAGAGRDGLHQAVEAKENVRDSGREPHDGDHHVPEPLPPLQEARRA